MVNFVKDVSEIRGQDHVLRALEIALVGNHTVTLWSTGSLMDALEIKYVAEQLGVQRVTVASYCPCGYWGSKEYPCSCTVDEVRKHQREVLAAPIMSDIHADVVPIRWENLVSERVSETNAAILARVNRAQELEDENLPVTPEARSLVKPAVQRLRLSGAYEYRRLLAVATSVARWYGETSITPRSLMEALQYRPNLNRALPEPSASMRLDDIHAVMLDIRNNLALLTAQVCDIAQMKENEIKINGKSKKS